MAEGHVVEYIGCAGVPVNPDNKTKFAMFRGVIFSLSKDGSWTTPSIVYDPYFRYRLTGETVNTKEWPIQTEKVTLQELYDYLEECAFSDGVPGVAQWIRDHIQEEYKIKLVFDPAVEEEW